MRSILMTLAALLCMAEAQTQIKLPSLIGSHMVLQRNASVAIWGEAQAGKNISVTTSWDGKTYHTRADEKGHWRTEVHTPDAGGPYVISIGGDGRILLDNILIGEVWIASGQSNMEMPITGFTGQPIEGAMEALMEAAECSAIRMFTVEKKPAATPQQDCRGTWKTSDAESVGQFSATAYFFAKYLNQTLGVPIGIIATSWGGSAIEAWMPRATLDKIAGLDMKAATAGKTDISRPELLYNGMIAPLKGFAARGFIWYQGESNLHNYFDYAKLMEALVSQWRTDWKAPQMPFYYVQLAPYNYANPKEIALPRQIEAQYEALKRIPHAAIAATTDLGHPTCIHPPKKKEVGQRLALLALERTYGLKGLPAQAPTVQDVLFQQSKVILKFNHLSGPHQPTGIRSLNLFNGPIRGFEIAGKDRKFYPAEARHIWAENQIELHCPQVPEPVAIRYAFRNYPDANVTTTMGLPLAPFRTDNWDDVW